MNYREGDFRAWCERLEQAYLDAGRVALDKAAHALDQGKEPRPEPVDVDALLAQLEAFPRLRHLSIQEAFRASWNHANGGPDWTPYLTDADVYDERDEAWEDNDDC